MLASTVHGQDRDADIEAIPGNPPDLRHLPPGCSFAPRCKYAVTACTEAPPPAFPVHGDGYARCIRLEAIAESLLRGEPVQA
jgi:peptide/nickel transport system ATP-binding protein